MNDNPQYKATNKYKKKAYDRIGLLVKKGEKEQIQAFAESIGLSLNAYITELIRKDMERNDTDNS